MSNLSYNEKGKLEIIFEMKDGYVLNFSNGTFQTFFTDYFDINIYDTKYEIGSGSKAKRLRAFWDKESNHIVGQSIINMLEYWKNQKNLEHKEISAAESNLAAECRKIAQRLKQESVIENIDAIQPYNNDKSFSLLEKSIKKSIYDNEPEAAIDRLHAYVVKYVRQLCDKHQIEYDINVPLHSLFGGYIKFLKQNEIIQSEMTQKILRSSIEILDSFNKVRNNQSLAHDNQNLLNYDESILILNNISNLIKFIQSIEKGMK